MRACLHGGHSRDFCDHAQDSLDDLAAAYARQGFSLVALTEHMPPLSNRWRYADEVALGRDAAWMAGRFAAYVQKARQLRAEYAGRMEILVGMETEWYEHAGPWIAQLRHLYALDMVVGSVHHVAGVCFDASPESYAQAQAAAGGLVDLYLAYFDAQLTLLKSVRPEVVGHFDIIRIFDPHGEETLVRPEVWARVRRNLEAVRDLGLVLDANVAAWRKGAAEIYPCTPVLEAARDMGIALAYGDDAHAVAHVGFAWERLDAHLRALGMTASVAGPQGSWPVWRAMPAT
ncbi:MAG: histidinol-phosphatase [Desulfomicrobiaceae bacterium]|jgi:histidinol-phosphatase (PHP family)|nr:histidinol-phosphatase [Desulfomicrobiaceae bacterium]